ncbi:xanthine dehydrogenase molybdopterin binding subunit [Pelagibius litoralis]|uniref:Xanthine dehydrogenase molybdopterin binding subunit n=1 Tax=Pelagibius litoralis TaxID=374515 RepID=A0A967EXB5_9PROT|nr:xanthine dehydrogenase molybdopterin binding subunit [Pelagibius litoralis]NIA68690.1 xanthine dehydrogenase molybdopterin binding subunit [Pelagibius litoralis]
MPERAEAIKGGVQAAWRHDSGHKHVSGAAAYIDDLPEAQGLLHVYLGLSTVAHARIKKLDLDAVRAAEGVEDVLTAADIPGANDISPTHRHDEPVLAVGIVEFVGQPIFAVAATTRDAARRAALLARVDYDPLPAVIGMAEARQDGTLVTDPMTLARGDAEVALKAAPRRLKGRMQVGGQEHFYLESQIAMAIPGEDDEVRVLSSTQHPTEIQTMVAGALDVPANAVTTEVRRMGGAFGGKETQGNLFAVIAALVAKKTGRAAKIRPDRDDDFAVTGKRHDFEIDYEVGFDDDGRILAVDMTYAARCGWSSDLSGPVTDRTLFHADNCYYFPDVRLTSEPLKTNTCSHTAFRGFGGPQGMIGGERVIEEVAFALGKDPLAVRRLNLYGPGGRDMTPYHQRVEDNIAPEIIEKLEADSGYQARRAEIRAFNETSRVIKRGLALTPVKFGISFTLTAYNQAGALVHIYRDGSIHLNHGGTEMGQGLYTKVAQVVAEAFQVDIDRVRITATSTGKVPNTSATAASSGSDINGMAALAACDSIKTRLVDFAAENWEVPKEQVEFLPGCVRVGNQEIAFADFVNAAYLARVSLSSTGFYKTPKIHWDRAAGRGRPFYYFSYGAAASEVAVDTLTGEYRVERVDILHDVGQSLNPALDLGQIEGGFVQGMGWLTTEELWWDDAGRLRTHAPSTYKIPACSDRPRVFNVALLEDSPNREETIYRSKAVGEPPLMLAISVLHALSDAVASVADHRLCPRLDAPATPERVLMTIERLRAEAAALEGGAA